MKTIFLIILIVCNCSCFEGRPKSEPVAVILDTDIGPDYDDVGALAVLHALADNGEAKILATISCNTFETAVPTLSVINTYFNRSDIPIGVNKESSHSYSCPRLWAEGIIAKYPHTLKSNKDAVDAVKLYRKILGSQADTSVTIISIGPFTNLAQLLHSNADEFSPLNGIQLVSKKVKRLVAMAAGIDSSGNGGYESNVTTDIAASHTVFQEWPAPIVVSGFEIGVHILTGMALIHNDAIKNSPVKDAYKIALTYDGSTTGHYSWDQTAVLVAVRSIRPHFDYRRLNFAIKNDGKDTVIAGNKIKYLTNKQKPNGAARIIEEMMMHMPKKKL